VEDAAKREAMEEVHIAVELTHLVGVYSRADSQIVLIVYAATTTDQPRTSEEASEVAVVDPAGIPWEELAFWSTELALRDYLSGPSPSR
jgi:ADP-ribose pyrophosphatase YjhB (NUDIX family)